MQGRQKTKTALTLAVLWGVLLWAGLSPALEGLQVTQLKGRFLKPNGQQLEEYDYLEAKLKYRLMPQTVVELSSLDGSVFYQAKGPGILTFDLSGKVTVNGKKLKKSSTSAPLTGLAADDAGGGKLGALQMRGQGGIEVKAGRGGSKKVRLYSGYHALVIGVSDYRKGWPRLPNPVKDAKEIAALLTKRGFKVDLVLDPTWAQLRKAFNNLIIGPGRNKETGVLVWFSGHGHTLAEADGSKLGYIVPVDAPDPNRDEFGFMEKAISMRFVETVARRIMAKHVLMAFDSCFSGAIFRTTRAIPPPFIEEKVQKPVRQFITAGNENEKVPDQSFFKEVFVQGIQDRFADRNKDGYVTGQELGAYLQEQVVNYSDKTQHPQYGKINNPKLDKGDFVFVLESATASAPQTIRADAAPSATAAPAASKPRPKKTLALKVASAAPAPKPSVVSKKALTGSVKVTSNVDGAEFSLGGQPFKTEKSAALTIGGIRPGVYDVVARKKGFKPFVGRVKVEVDKTAAINIQLERPGLKKKAGVSTNPGSFTVKYDSVAIWGGYKKRPVELTIKFADGKISSNFLMAGYPGSIEGKLNGLHAVGTFHGFVSYAAEIKITFAPDFRSFQAKFINPSQDNDYNTWTGKGGEYVTGSPLVKTEKPSTSSSTEPVRTQASQGDYVVKYDSTFLYQGSRKMDFPLSIKFKKGRISGSFWAMGSPSSLEGRLDGLRATGNFSCCKYATTGTFTFDFSADFKSFTGKFATEQDARSYTWTGTKGEYLKGSPATKQAQATRSVDDNSSAPGDSEEARIINTLAGWGKAWKTLNVAQLLSYYATEAQIQVRVKGQKRTLSKQAFARFMNKKADNFERDGFKRTWIKAQKVEIDGTTARVISDSVLDIKSQGRRIELIDVIQLKKKGGKWLIVSYKAKRL